MIALNEAPVFDDLGRVAVTFACELTDNPVRLDPDCGYRLTQIYRELFGPPGERRTVEPCGAELDRARRLFTGSRSFIDDITTGPPGVNGRPLFMAAELDGEDRSARTATILRPESWMYEFESTCVELFPAAESRNLPVTFNDQFCVFESGRIFYLASFGQCPEQAPRLDEYALIQLQRLTFDASATLDPNYLAFAFTGEGADPACSLFEFLCKRLVRLCAGPGDDRPNAIRDVLQPFGILKRDRALTLRPREWLRNGLVQVEDEALLATARHAHGFFSIDDGLPAEGGGGEAALPPILSACETAWRRRHAGVVGERPPHLASQIDGGEDGDIVRPILAFAGLAQGVPDFPRQDYSEVHDSTRPATSAPEGMFYVHPAFELALGINWRTFRDAQEEIGGCPYAIMAWIIGLHDEVIVTDMEQRIERMIYGEPTAGTSAALLGRAEPAADLMGVWRRAANVWRPRNATMDRNLRARLDIFRWCSIHRSGNVFRYPTERELLLAIEKCRGTDTRFADAHGALDRYENLVEDLSSLTAHYAAIRANWLLGAITVFGLIGLPTAIAGTAQLVGLAVDPLWAAVALLAMALMAYLVWNRGPARR